MLEKENNTLYNNIQTVQEIQSVLQDNQGINTNIFIKENTKHIVSHGDNSIHIQSLKNKVVIYLKKYCIRYRIAHPLSKKWIIIHTDSFICHIMSHEAREYYNIENSEST